MAERKTLQDLTIKDNFMFGAVMMNEEICRELLELVLGFRIAKVMVSKEKCFVYHPEYKGVRLDILTADGRKYRYTFDMACREDSFIKRVQTAVRNVKASREMEEQYMLLEELIKEEREQALAEGRELGLTEGQISSILELLSYLGEVPEKIKEAVSEENDAEEFCNTPKRKEQYTKEKYRQV